MLFIINIYVENNRTCMSLAYYVCSLQLQVHVILQESFTTSFSFHGPQLGTSGKTCGGTKLPDYKQSNSSHIWNRNTALCVSANVFFHKTIVTFKIKICWIILYIQAHTS